MNNSDFSKDLHISAMVQLSKLQTNINLYELARSLETNRHLLYIEYGSEITKGHNPKKKPKKKLKKYFYNQITVHVYNESKMNHRINVKIFNNGRIQMTGINNEYQGAETIQILSQECNRLSEIDKISIFDVEGEIIPSGEIETVLINSDFDVHFMIDREILHRLIIDQGYFSSYEPCTYPGVNIKYYHNPLANNFGICDCDKPCNGKGKDQTCKKITVAVFKSGKIIITGGRSKDNISVAHKFITEFIQENKEKIQLN